MKEFVKSEIKKLNINLEIITYLFNVPIATCFGVMNLQAYGEKFITFLVAVVYAASTAFVFSILCRTYVLESMILKDISQMDSKSKQDYKLKLFKLPFFCGGVIIQIQWIIGMIVMVLYYSSVHGLTWNVVNTFICIFAFLSPLNFTTHSSRTEIFIKKILQLDSIREIKLTQDQLKYTNNGYNFLRIFTAFISPIYFILAVLITLYINGVIENKEDIYKKYFLVFILFDSVIVIVNSSRLIATNIRLNIENLVSGINEMSNGNLKSSIAVVDNEELGDATLELDILRERIIEIMKEINSISVKLNHVSIDLNKNSEEVAKEAQSQATFSEEVSASMDEFSASIEQSTALAEEQVQAVNTSANSLNKLENEINSTLNYSNESSKLSTETKDYSNEGQALGIITQKAIEEIKLVSGDIVEYTNIINDIAERVGLLSINASIEAARAGENGRGFSVVASEISKLGESTNQNSVLIQKKVVSLTKKVSDGLEKTRVLLKSFNNILIASEKTDLTLELMKENMQRQMKFKEEVKSNLEELIARSNTIKITSSEQKSTIQAFSKGVESLKIGSEQLAISSESLNSISKELLQDSEQLNSKILFFKLK